MAGVGPGDLDVLAFELLEASVAALDSIPGFTGLETLAGAPDRQATSPGAPAADCEQVTVHAAIITERDATKDSRTNQVQLIVTVFRCVPGPQSNLKPPKVGNIEAAAAQTNADAWALWNHIWNMIRAGCLLRKCRPVTMSMRALEQKGQFGGWALTITGHLDGYEEADPCAEEVEE